MKTDRELLIAAARTAGIEWFGYYGDQECDCRFLDIGKEEVIGWNPLTNDQDAITLALVIHSYDSIKVVNGRQCIRTWSGLDDEESRANTRRAIVVAAAMTSKPSIWICSKCGIDRGKVPCPKGYHAALTGECPMTGTAQ